MLMHRDKPVKMDPDVKEKWCEALESGQYRQGRAYLNRGEHFCCWGVLCEVLKVPHSALYKSPGGNLDVVAYEGATTLPTPAILKQAGLETAYFEVDIEGNLQTLQVHNDAGHGFLRIAKAIRENL